MQSKTSPDPAETDTTPHIAGWIAVICVTSLILLINLSVLIGMIGTGPLISFDSDVFLLGGAISLATLADLQWQIFALMLLSAIGPLVVTGAHVRVDFLAETFTNRTRQMIDIASHLIFGLPFALIFLAPAWRFFSRSWAIDENGLNGGMHDIYVIKFVLFGCFVLLGLCIVLRLVLDVKSLGERQ
ncbi:TRAP transporter small permease subunit [Hwanghaeella sp. LZ110]|uniref:TRAP transporter small permease subunit n=1 Tax=Hwanghaeella sp. LZ110 TaxID=3402810 RepID=UPI003B683E95